MTWKDWLDLAGVYRAGATRSQQLIVAYAPARMGAVSMDAEILLAMAGRCEEIAREKQAS